MREERNPNERDLCTPGGAMPAGYGSGKCYPARHNRWVTLDLADKAPLEYDALQIQGPGHSKKSLPGERKEWKLTHTSVKRNGAMIEAVNLEKTD